MIFIYLEILFILDFYLSYLFRILNNVKFYFISDF